MPAPSSHHDSPHLRIVGTPAERWANGIEIGQAAGVVRSENLRAAGNPTLDPADPRWVLAVRVRSQLQGATLTPERRERVMRTADSLGIRPFQASLIIAMVQDSIRSGRPLAATATDLAVIDGPSRAEGAGWVRWASAIGCAAVASALLVRWIAY